MPNAGKARIATLLDHQQEARTQISRDRIAYVKKATQLRRLPLIVGERVSWLPVT